jgi:CheY-like chemotaxis protein
MESAHRAAALTHRLLAFARQQPIDPRSVDENRLLASTEELLRRTMGEGLQLNFNLADDLWLVRCDANQLENVVLNLAINARDAMPAGGSITFKTSNRHLTAAEAGTKDLRPGEYVCLTVTDTGSGMSRATQERIFDPFFTTKSIGKGTGLGLSMVYGFVKQSDGSIVVRSEAGIGTEFEIWLPRFKGESDENPAIKDDTQSRADHSGVVLVVEDESIVRILIVEVLKELGYQPLEVDTGASALRILRSAQRIDLLVTDIGLPDITGRQVADIARTLRKDLRVLFMTGYAEKAASGDFLQQGMEIITKPFTMDTFAARIQKIIESE